VKSLFVQLGVVLIGLSIFGGLEVWGAEDEVRYSCNNIKTGMTQDEVLNVLGFPSDRKSESPPMGGRSLDSRGFFDSKGGVERWSYNRYGKLPLNILFIDGKVTNCQD
jgi:hypothetical protein